MPSRTVASILQVIIGVGLLNVWLVRREKRTAYRGGTAQSLRQEFAAYGLPAPMFYAVGTLKVVSAIILLAGLWMNTPVSLAAAVVASLMVGALAMHTRVKDPLVKSVPAAVMLVLCATLLIVR